MPFSDKSVPRKEEVEALFRVVEIKQRLERKWKEGGLKIETSPEILKACYLFFSEYPALDEEQQPITFTIIGDSDQTTREIDLGDLRQQTGYYQGQSRDEAIFQMMYATLTVQAKDPEAFRQNNLKILRGAREIR